MKKASVFYKKEELCLIEIPKRGGFISIIGESFGRLQVIGFAGKSKHNLSEWFCQCQCGNISKKLGVHLKSGRTRSCGCLNIETIIKNKTTHGYAKQGKTPEYRTWRNMISRCTNPNVKCFSNYGGRGIKICNEWEKFENFLADMGERPEGKTIERIENDKGYYKENCRWATKKEQANNKRNNVPFTFNGKTQNAAQWEAELGLKKSYLSNRLYRGQSIERIIEWLQKQ